MKKIVLIMLLAMLTAMLLAVGCQSEKSIKVTTAQGTAEYNLSGSDVNSTSTNASARVTSDPNGMFIVDWKSSTANDSGSSSTVEENINAVGEAGDKIIPGLDDLVNAD